jgi:hypothetical protein
MRLSPWEFVHRSRRPPRDPVNALLSLSYTLALHSIGRQATRCGLEAGIGFLHTPLRGRPALALDLYELAAWDMEDRELGETLDRENRHHLARRSREAARQTAQELYLSRCELQPVDVGERFSRSSGTAYPLQGFQGTVELAGPVAVALPWLLALILGGGGQKRAMGFGVVCGWLGLAGGGE